MGHGSNDRDDAVASSTERNIDAEDIDADEISSRRFSVTLRGYDRAEVGHFLEQVAAAHRTLRDELDATRAELLLRRQASVVGVSSNLDEIDLTDSQDDAHDEVPSGEDDEAFDRMVRDALDHAVKTSRTPPGPG